MAAKKLFLFLFFINTVTFGQNKFIELSINYQSGYGSFNWSYLSLRFGSIPKEYPLYKALSSYEYKNIPDDLKNVEKGLIILDHEQLINQNYLLKNISEEELKALLYNAPTNNLRKYTKTNIASVLLLLKGINSDGKEVIILDCNNNGDFMDEKAFEPEDFNTINFENNNRISKIRYEVFDGEKVLNKYIPIRILKNGKQYLYNFPQYATTELLSSGKKYSIAVNGKFLHPAFTAINVALNSGKINKDSVAEKSGILHIDKNDYKVIGIDPAKDVLVLDKIKTGMQSINQIGYKAPSIIGKDIIKSNTVILADYKGKYIYLDFWGSWCGPCIDQIPMLKNIYEMTSRDQIVFIGVATNEKNYEGPKDVIAKNNIPWLNVFSNSKNLIAQRYNIQSYPTGILIDPNGIIISKKETLVELKKRLIDLKIIK